MAPTSEGAIGIIAGSGEVPPLVAAAALRAGFSPLVLAIAGEGDARAFPSLPVHEIRWGEVGRLFRVLQDADCRQVVFVGTITRRPDLRSVRPDLGGLSVLPRVWQLVRGGDSSLLDGAAAIFAEKGIALRGPLEIAPDLTLPEGSLAGSVPDRGAQQDVQRAAEAARMAGRLDIGQAAVAVAGRVVAVEGAEGTDGLMERIAHLRKAGRVPRTGGVLVKCMKPQQDLRLDVPTLGPLTAENARRCGLDGVAAEAGRTLLAGRAETIEAFRCCGLFLLGIATPPPPT